MVNKEKIKGKYIINVKEHRIDSKFLITIVIFLVAILLISTSIIFNQLVISSKSVEEDLSYGYASDQLMQTSNYLTNRVYFYVATGDEKYYIEYTRRLAETRDNDVTINKLIELSPTERETAILVNTLAIVEKLGVIEKEAFDLIKDGKIEQARKLLFISEYVEYKDQLENNYRQIQVEIANRAEIRSHNVLSFSKITLFISSSIAIGTTIVIILLILTVFRIKKEANVDQLTGLQNRNNYKNEIESLIKREKDKFGALVYCDIDNFKYIDEYYGHTSGDRYIQATANILKEFGKYKSVIARPFGDEFIVYIHGFDSKDEVVSIISEKLNKAKNSYFTTALNIEEKIRFSTGVAIYPNDTNDVDELIKYADFAMYKMKKNSKGEIAYYDSTTIDSTLFFARNSGYLDEFLDKELLDFALQPMIDANTFEVFGYEALMRPQSEVINTPYLLLELAKSESKLDKIERLVMKKVFEKIDDNKEQLKGYKIFINSIADQLLTKEEFDVYKNQYPEILSKIVLEVTEQESVDYEVLRVKSNMFKKAGALLAIDDFGAGYSNENSLLNNDYDIIKLDMNLIRNIDTDTRRQQIVKSMINFSNTHNYKILAEGVETENEVRELRNLGIHYMQGYYFGKPAIEINGVSEKALRFLKQEREKSY